MVLRMGPVDDKDREAKDAVVACTRDPGGVFGYTGSGLRHHCGGRRW